MPKRKKLILTAGQQIRDCVFLHEESREIHPKCTIRVGRFRCSCGKEFSGRLWAVISGKHRSCGCSRDLIKPKTKHGATVGHKHTTEYNIWCLMRKRCGNENDGAYARYGGRGIQVCDRWQYSFINFLSDMGYRPSKLYSLERVNNNGNYCPENCIWATAKVQGRNKRNTIKITHNSITLPLVEWAERLKISSQLVRQRIYNGSTHSEALTMPLRRSPVLVPIP